jgi:glycosyltransferase involved in cell wall biosynthesis
MARRLASPAFAAAVAHEMAARPPDWTIVEGIEMAPYRHQVDGRWLFDDHNAEYLLQQRSFLGDMSQLYRPRAAAGAAYSLVQWQRLRRYERTVCRAADAVTVVSPADRAALQRLDPALDPIVVPNGVDLAEWSPDAIPPDPAAAALAAQGPLLVFDGSMDFRPNVGAVRWFCAACWPAIRAVHPSAGFAIVGRNPAPAVQALGALPGVRVTGSVADTRPWVAAATVYVVPMRVGGGVRLKVLQALALGRPMVSTTVGAEGVDLVPGRDLCIADTAPAFSAAVNRLLADPAARAALTPAARAAVAPYAWERIVPGFEAVLLEF